jgi:hypothetical protein
LCIVAFNRLYDFWPPFSNIFIHKSQVSHSQHLIIFLLLTLHLFLSTLLMPLFKFVINLQHSWHFFHDFQLNFFHLYCWCLCLSKNHVLFMQVKVVIAYASQICCCNVFELAINL